MRSILMLLVPVVGGLAFTACSKQADTAPAGAASSPAPAPAASSSPGTALASPGAPLSNDQAASDISFNLGGDTQSAGVSPGVQTLPPEGDYVEPRQINAIYPFYPLSLRMRGIEGRVDVQVRINTEGRVESAEVVQATEERLAPYALAAVRTAQFIPAREKGKPVAAVGHMRVPFISEIGSGSLDRNSILARIAFLDGAYYTKDASGRMVPAEIKDPIRLSIVTPYPGNAKPGETLKARVKVAVSEEGQVTSVTVSDASTPEFGAALKEVAPFWQFIPRIKAGKALATPAVEFPISLAVPGAG